jgi:hypothetical protein
MIIDLLEGLLAHSGRTLPRAIPVSLCWQLTEISQLASSSEKFLADKADVKGRPFVEGIYESLEHWLLSFEVTSHGSRRKPMMNRLQEFLKRSSISAVPSDLSLGNSARVLLDPQNLYRLIDRHSCAVDMKKRLRKLWKSGKYSEVVVILHDRNIPYSRLLGDGKNFHFLEDSSRFLHLLGLAEAISLAMSSLSIRVRFPNPTRICHRKKTPTVSLDSLIQENLSFVLDENRRGPKFRAQRRALITAKLHEWKDIGRVVNRPRYQNVWYRLTVHYIHNFPSGLPEKDYVKLIKFSLAHRFSLEASQELPTGFEPIPLFPICTDLALKNRFRYNRKERIQFFKHLLESKALCHEVSRDMIDEAYDKHFKSLCRPPSEVTPISQNTLRGLYDYGVRVGREVAKIYKPDRTVLPNKKATVHSSKQRGGSLSDLQGNLEIQRGPISRSYLKPQDTNSIGDQVRPEPLVIGLFGPPGSGKSTLVQNLISEFQSYFSFKGPRSDYVYSRSCSTEHWDGYTGQPIVVLDDFGQNVFDRKDVVEFENIVSCNEYIVPMAELENKGQRFISPIIIVTTNLFYGSLIRDSSGGLVLADELAVWRRFHLPFMVLEKGIYPFRKSRLISGSDSRVEFSHTSSHVPSAQHGRYHTEHGFNTTCYWAPDDRSERESFTEILNLVLNEDYKPNDSRFFVKQQLEKEFNLLPGTMFHRGAFKWYTTHVRQKQPGLHTGFLSRSWRLSPPCTLNLFSKITETFESRLEYHRNHHEGIWQQTISEGSFSVFQAEAPFYGFSSKEGYFPLDPGYFKTSLVFDSVPPFHPPRVDAVAIPEPLKVRMITKAEKEVRCLKPLQMALFEYLKSQPQFALTHGVSWSNEEDFSEKLEWIHRTEVLIKSIRSRMAPDELWLSGDYTSATDDFPMSVTNALVHGILSQIDHEPTRRWVLYEISPHEIRYPNGVMGKQTSGQLMGSLLSFPLLCFLNDYLVSTSGFKPGKYLINGDDVVACGKMETIQNWRANAPRVGLSLSLGKNYIDPEFCCVNSQLFWNGKVLHTGKATTMVRRGKSIGSCFSSVQFHYGLTKGLKSDFIRKNLLLLRETPQSLDIPTHLGGLGLYYRPYHGDEVDLKLAKEVYLTKFLSKISRSFPVPGMDFVRMLHIPSHLLDDSDISGLREGTGDPTTNLISSLEIDMSPEKDSDTFDMRWTELKHTRNILTDHPDLWNKIQGRKLCNFPPLGALQTRPIFIGRDKVGWIKRKMIEISLQALIAEVDRRTKIFGNVIPEFSPSNLPQGLEDNEFLSSIPSFESVSSQSLDVLTEHHYDLMTEVRDRKERESHLSQGLIHELTEAHDPFFDIALESSLLPCIEEEDDFKDSHLEKDHMGRLVLQEESTPSRVQSSLFAPLPMSSSLFDQSSDISRPLDPETKAKFPTPHDLEGGSSSAFVSEQEKKSRLLPVLSSELEGRHCSSHATSSSLLQQGKDQRTEHSDVDSHPRLSDASLTVSNRASSLLGATRAEFQSSSEPISEKHQGGLMNLPALSNSSRRLPKRPNASWNPFSTVPLTSDPHGVRRVVTQEGIPSFPFPVCLEDLADLQSAYDSLCLPRKKASKGSKQTKSKYHRQTP